MATSEMDYMNVGGYLEFNLTKTTSSNGFFWFTNTEIKNRIPIQMYATEGDFAWFIEPCFNGTQYGGFVNHAVNHTAIANTSVTIKVICV